MWAAFLGDLPKKVESKAGKSTEGLKGGKSGKKGDGSAGG